MPVFFQNFRVSQNAGFYWQSDSKIHLPGSTVSVANQFLRCVLHQLAPNGIFTQIFQTQVPGQFFLLTVCVFR